METTSDRPPSRCLFSWSLYRRFQPWHAHNDLMCLTQTPPSRILFPRKWDLLHDLSRTFRARIHVSIADETQARENTNSAKHERRLRENEVCSAVGIWGNVIGTVGARWDGRPRNCTYVANLHPPTQQATAVKLWRHSSGCPPRPWCKEDPLPAFVAWHLLWRSRLGEVLPKTQQGPQLVSRGAHKRATDRLAPCLPDALLHARRYKFLPGQNSCLAAYLRLPPLCVVRHGGGQTSVSL